MQSNICDFRDSQICGRTWEIAQVLDKLLVLGLVCVTHDADAREFDSLQELIVIPNYDGVLIGHMLRLAVTLVEISDWSKFFSGFRNTYPYSALCLRITYTKADKLVYLFM